MLGTLPAYVPGRTVPGRDQAGQQRDALPAAAARARAHRRRGRRRQPLPGQLRHRADRGARREATASTPSRCGSAAARCRCAPSSCRPSPTPTTRSSTPGARSRRTRSSPRSAARRRSRCRCATHVHDLDAMAERITGKTRLIFVCNPNNPTGTAVGRDALVRFLRARARRRRRRARRGLPRVRHRPRRAGRADAARRVPEPRRAADVLQGVRAGRPAGRVRDRRPTRRSPPRCAQTQVPFAVTRSRRRRRWPRSRRRPRRSCAQRVAEVVAERVRVRDALLGLGLRRAADPGQLRLAAARRRDAGVGGRLRGPRRDRPRPSPAPARG